MTFALLAIVEQESVVVCILPDIDAKLLLHLFGHNFSESIVEVQSSKTRVAIFADGVDLKVDRLIRVLRSRGVNKCYIERAAAEIINKDVTVVDFSDLFDSK